MKWIVLILIIIVILIVFALWRRMQVRSEQARSSPPAAPSENVAITRARLQEPTSTPTPAMEAGVDEDIPAPASENPATESSARGQAASENPAGAQPTPTRPTRKPDDWWDEDSEARPQP